MLHEPYIVCAECEQKEFSTKTIRLPICLECFGKGVELKNHLNNHSYMIRHDNVNIFPNTSSWSARHDNTLLDLLTKYNFANWSDISRKIKLYSADECQNHYIQNYFDGIFWQPCKLTKFPYNRIEIPYFYQLNTFDPPRMSAEMADYRFTRSDFDTPYDISAENIICNLYLDKECNNDFKQIGEDLNCAMVIAYNNRLR